jgi:hypothetical protein
MPLQDVDLAHYAARAKSAILCAVDDVPDNDLKEKIRRTVLDSIELLERRVLMDLKGQGGMSGVPPRFR